MANMWMRVYERVGLSYAFINSVRAVFMSAKLMFSPGNSIY